MCCYSSKLGIKELRKMMKENGGTMTFWKVVYAFDHHYNCGTEYTSIHRKHYWVEGVHSCPEALSQKDSGYYPELEINEGFHVYLDKNRAMQVRMQECSPGVVLLEVTCNVKDLIGAEEYTPDNLYHYTAVFSKVTVTKDQWKRLKRRTRDARRRYLR